MFPVTLDAPGRNKANMRSARQMVHLGSSFVPLTVTATDQRTHRLSVLMEDLDGVVQTPFRLTENLSGPAKSLNVCWRVLMVRMVFVPITGASFSRCSFRHKHERFWRLKNSERGTVMWNERYRGETFAYGTEPNSFLVEHAGLLAGSVLSLAEGEGRNAVYLASLGLDVLAKFIGRKT